jgi:glycosyltransferase involved in cell wall biosynthesis
MDMDMDTDMDKVSVIIPTYNRFKYLLNTIKSVKEQTYPNIEIIVVNDKSIQKEYYDYDWESNNIKIIHLEKNSKDIFGYACAGGYQRNFGIEKATGDYIAFCDDDDIWFPNKIELQLKAMRETGCKMSSTDGLIGNGIFNPTKSYKKYLADHHYKTLQNIYNSKDGNLLNSGFPIIWNLIFLKIHNCVICSSVMIKKDVIDEVGKFIIANRAEDYQYWLRVLQHTDSVYVKDICFYYDSGHGDGQHY